MLILRRRYAVSATIYQYEMEIWSWSLSYKSEYSLQWSILNDHV